MNVSIGGLALLALFTTLDCSAALLTEDPAVVCSILRDTQLLAGSWTQTSGSEARCQSPARPVRGDEGQSSEMTYLAEGEGDRVQRVSLIIKVKNQNVLDAAEREPVHASNRLSVRLLGLSIPTPIREALEKPAPANAMVGSGSIRVYREPIKGSHALNIFVVIE